MKLWPALAVSLFATAAAADPVTWTNAQGVSVSGTTLTKISGGTGYNGGASSVEVIADGFGFAEATASETTTGRAFGLSCSARQLMHI
jgi:hypothetical protein